MFYGGLFNFSISQSQVQKYESRRLLEGGFFGGEVEDARYNTCPALPVRVL